MDKLSEKLAHALCWQMSVGKQGTPRKMFLAQTDGCRERFREEARELLECIRAAGLVVTVRK